MMIGFEGSGPDKASLFGAHGLKSAFESNERSQTGQGTASTLGLPTATRGGVRAVVDQAHLDRWATLTKNMEILHEHNPAMERALFKQLLASTNQEERANIESDANQIAEFYRG
jgi:hypothetical protein